MEEQIVTFETAKILKEKNIIIDCFHHYDTDGGLTENSVSNKSHVATHHLYANNTDFELDRWGGGNIYSIAAPDQSQLQKWLRDEHIIHIVVEYTGKYFVKYKKGYGSTYINESGQNFKTYEDALESGLLEALKLI